MSDRPEAILQGKKRPFSVAFTAVPKAGSPGQTVVVKGSAKC